MPLDALASWLPFEPDALLWAGGLAVGSAVAMKAPAAFRTVLAWSEQLWIPAPVVVPAVTITKIPPKTGVKKKRPAVVKPPRPKNGPRVRWLEGTLSRVRGEFYFDDCCSDPRLHNLFRAHGLAVVTAKQAGNYGADDLVHWKYATCHRMACVTEDKGFRAMHKRGVKHAGIIHTPQGPAWHMEILRVALSLSPETSDV